MENLIHSLKLGYPTKKDVIIFYSFFLFDFFYSQILRVLGGGGKVKVHTIGSYDCIYLTYKYLPTNPPSKKKPNKQKKNNKQTSIKCSWFLNSDKIIKIFVLDC